MTEYVRVRFCGSYPGIVGTDSVKYGPFEDGDTAEMPEDSAEVLIARGNAEKVEETSDDNFDFRSATGIAPDVEVVEWVEDTDPKQPKKIRLYHNGTDYGVFVKESDER
ncbi:DNA replication complex subunit Gins51 [Halococcus sediminicola]|uniref:DNA replication complex subunit Gins51 n=1 Tax=Halococcus sediminicola TaxID=1264579 RepID=UPI0006786BE5|nr:hypothetical protein [Halococcus sediminicola]